MKKIIGVLFIAFSMSAVAGISSESSFAANDVTHEFSMEEAQSYDNSEIVELTCVSSFELSDTVLVVRQNKSAESVHVLGVYEVANRERSRILETELLYTRSYLYNQSNLGKVKTLNLTKNRKKFISLHRKS